MSMAKRQEDLKDPGVRQRIEDFLKEEGAEDEARPSRLRGSFEKWATEIGFRNFTVKDENADDLDLEYCDGDVELVWCAFAEGAANGQG